MNARKATAPAKAATETAPAALTFEDAAVPDTTRAAKPNPYAEVVGSIKGSDTARPSPCLARPSRRTCGSCSKPVRPTA